MNKEYKIKLDLNKKLYNKKMAFNQFDENVNDFYIEVTKNNKVVKDLDKSIITLVAIKPNSEVDAQFIEVKEGQIYANLKPSMCDLVGNYQAKAMIVLEGEIVTTDTINYSVNEDKIISRLNDDVVSDERFTLFTDALARLSTIEISEEQRMINEAERILSEENRKIEEAKRVEAELVRQHEEADRTKYDATRESNENIRKQNESIRLANETNRIDEEAKRVEEENKRKLAEEERNANYNFMTEDEERRRSEANAHKEAEVLRVQAETSRVNEEAKRRTTEQARVSAENTRVGNENTREANEVTRKNNETQRVEAETQRQNRYNSFITDAEANANNFENYTNNAKVKEEERKANELDRKSQEDRRVSNETERISNENSRKANEVVREENETSRQNIFENKVSEVNEKIVELNTTKDNFVSSINTKVDNKISELDNAKSDMTNTVSNKVNEVETRFNALTSKQQQDAEVIDARDGETSLKARLDRDIEKAKQVYVNVEGNHISTDSSVGYLKDVEILGNTVQDASNLADIRSVGDKVEGQELYEIPVLSVGKNLLDNNNNLGYRTWNVNNGNLITNTSGNIGNKKHIRIKPDTQYTISCNFTNDIWIVWYDSNKKYISSNYYNKKISPSNAYYMCFYVVNGSNNLTVDNVNIQLEEGTVATPYEPYQEDKLTILSPVQLEKVGDVADRIIEKDGVWGVEKNVETIVLDGSESYWRGIMTDGGITKNMTYVSGTPFPSDNMVNRNGICDRLQLIQGNQFTFTGYNQIALHNSPMYSNYMYISTQCSSLEEFKQQLLANPITLLYTLKTPQFIPLPHDQQVKLRTFANKTNISFLTEIEGTIKAQVPKSLGATVNTHTEQINNLNKELDRVKKLEESTVSTVTTESDFTTVEATSNGYFEDVKLEGKTLVNKIGELEQGYISGSTGESLASPNRVRTKNCISLGDSITIITNFMIQEIICFSNDTFVKSLVGANINKNIYKVDKSNDFNQIKVVFKKSTNENVLPSELKNIILEGDHTQNPPSFFEGLKSVGQSDTTSEADEIVVESVKGDGNLYQGKDLVVLSDNNGWGKFRIDGHFEKNTSYTISGKHRCSAEGKNPRFVFEYTDGTSSTNNNIATPTISNFSVTSDKNKTVKHIKMAWSSSTGSSLYELNDVMLVRGESSIPYTPHQSDKKRLLYYNNETQTWEKPILRQWDSIEKHADGKYYYHQRSGEVVLNGSENWNQFSDTQEGFARFALWLNDMKMLSDGVNNIFTWISGVTFANSTNNETIGSHINSTNLYVNVLGNRLSTQDVQGFKQWLQANNVTVVYQLAEEKVYECTNIDLITYSGETNFIVESGVLSPKTTLKVHNNISNVVSLLQKKVSLLESNVTSYMITQNRLMLASRYNADTVSFKVDVATLRNSFEYDNDLYELILNNILVGKDNYNREYIENLIIFYWMDFVISDEMYLTLFEIIEEQHNPKVIEEAPIE